MNTFNLQTAVYNALVADAPLMAIVSGVYDNVPQNTAFPYISLGEDITTPYDTDTFTGSSNLLTFHVWTRESGSKEAKEIMGIIYGILNRNILTVTDADTVDLLFITQTTTLDPDNITNHGFIQFRATLVNS